MSHNYLSYQDIVLIIIIAINARLDLVSAITCSSGTYALGVSSSNCTSCLAGKYSTTLGATAIETCISCAAGKYASTNGSSTCTLCQTGKYAATSGVSYCADCGRVESAFYWWNNYQLYTEFPGSTVCKPTCKDYYIVSSSESLIPGYFQCGKPNNPKPWDCQDCACLAGSYYAKYEDEWYFYEGCFNCSVGWFSNISRAPACTPCEAGKYVTATGATSCVSCTVGKYSNISGLALNTSCIACATGKHASMSGATSCVSCTVGKYSDISVLTLNTSCIACVTGKYASMSGASVCTACETGKYASGTVAAANSSNCIACLPGKFSSAAGATICSVCASGKYTTASNTINCAQCSNTPICQNPPGYLQNCTAAVDALCINCNDADKPLYSSWKRSSSVQYSCTWICDTGYFKMNSSTCQACKSPSSCTTSQYVTTCNTTVDGLCLGCNNKPLDSFYTGASPLYSVSACSWSCNSGYSLNQSSSKCDPLACQAGKYVVGSPPTCISCPSGTYSVNASSSSCSICTFNTYTPSIGASACTKCPRCAATGQYSIGCGGTSSGTCVKCTNTIN